MKINVILAIAVLFLVLPGCVSASKKIEGLDNRVTQLEGVISSKEAEIKELQGLLADRKRQLDEKDSRIEELRKKLEMFGVFEK